MVTLVERSDDARSFHVDNAAVAPVTPILRENVDRETVLKTDESGIYVKRRKEFASHESVNHSADEYVRGGAHTNTVEGFFSIFERGFKGIYQHSGEDHLHSCLAEYDFRYNNRVRFGINDTRRMDIASVQAEGKRLTYRRIGGV